MKYLATALLLATSMLVSAQEEKPKKIPTYTDVPLELKGVPLGIAYEQAASFFEGANCYQSEKMIGFSYCENNKAQFADGKAKLMATFIDGLLVRIQYTNIQITKYTLVGDAFTAKYGESSKDGSYENRIYIPNMERQSTQFWRSKDLQTLAFTFPTRESPATFGIQLMIESKKYNAYVEERTGGKPAKPKTNDI